MKKPYIAKKQTYLNTNGNTTFTVYHPAILFKYEKEYFYIPDEITQTGLVEYDNEEDALRNAEALYKFYYYGKS